MVVGPEIPRWLFRIGGMVLAALCVPGEAAAQSRWIYSVGVPVEVEHDSNPNMGFGSPAAVRRLRASPDFKARYRLEQEEFDLSVGATLERSDQPAVSADRNDPRVRGDWRRVTDVSAYGLYALVDQRAYRALEVEERAPLALDGTRTLRAVGGNWLRNFTQNLVLTADVRQDWATFDAGAAADYRLTTGNAQLSHELDERRTWYTAANFQAYRSDVLPGALGSGSASSGSRGASVGYRSLLSPALSWDISAGIVELSGANANTGWQGSAKLTYLLPRLQLTLEASRKPTASAANSGLGLSNVARIQLRYTIDAETTLSLEANSSQLRALQSSRAAVYSAVISRQLSPSWALAARAQHRRRSEPLGSAHATVVGITLTYASTDL
jgi:hypothetical protein